MVYPIPNRTALFLTEASVKYLTLAGNNIFSKALKVASYVLSLGILPLIAYKIAGSYYSVRCAEYRKILSFAEQSLPNALWVTQNIKNFRLDSVLFNSQIADTIVLKIAENYDSFLQQCTRQNNYSKWFENFDLERWKRSSIFRSLVEKVDRYAGLGGVEYLNNGRVFERMGDYEFNQQERTEIFNSLAFQGIVPKKEFVTPDERISIINSLIIGPRHYYGRDLVFKAIREYELTSQQRYEVCVALANKGFLDFGVQEFLAEFPALRDDQIYVIASACIKCEMIRRKDSAAYFIETILRTLSEFRISPIVIPTLLQQCELIMNESEAEKVREFIQLRVQ